MLHTYNYYCATNLVVHGETTGNNTNVVYYNLTDDNVSYTWSTFNPYNRSEAFIVQAEEGYNILVTVTECDIAGDDGDFLLIKSGLYHGKVPELK